MDPKTFVVPLDGSPYSERALPIATALAERIGGSLLLVTTESMGPMGAREYLDEIAARGFPCPVEINTFTDRPAVSAILATVNGADDRVVCMTTHGRGRIAWTVLGSVAEAVTWGSEREMVLVGAHCRSDTPADTAALLIASDAGSSSQGLAAGALTWSDMLGLQRRVAVVVHPLDVESAEHPARIAVPLAGEYGVEPTSIILRRDEYPAGALVEIAEQLPAAMIAMGTHRRHGVKRMALGSVTMSVVHHAPCPVLAVPRQPTG